MPFQPGMSGNPRGRPRNLERELARLGRALVNIEQLTEQCATASMLQGKAEIDQAALERIEALRRHLARDVAELRVTIDRAGLLEDFQLSNRRGRGKRRRRLEREREQAIAELGAWIDRECGWHMGAPN